MIVAFKDFRSLSEGFHQTLVNLDDHHQRIAFQIQYLNLKQTLLEKLITSYTLIIFLKLLLSIKLTIHMLNKQASLLNAKNRTKLARHLLCP